MKVYLRGGYIRLAFLLCVIFIMSCARLPVNEENNLIGKYLVYDRTCQGSVEGVKYCESVRVVEFVKGRFYGVDDDALAFVIWRGDPKEALLYTANAFMGTVVSTEGKVFASLNDDNGVREYVEIFIDGRGQYTFEETSSRGVIVERTLFKIELSQFNKADSYLMDYPGNN